MREICISKKVLRDKLIDVKRDTDSNLVYVCAEELLKYIDTLPTITIEIEDKNEG